MGTTRLEAVRAKKAKVKASQKYQITSDKVLTDAEVEQLLTTIKKYPCRDTLALELLLKTGCRATELLLIEPEDLNHIAKSVTIVGLKGSNTREIPLEEELFNRLAAQCKDGLPFPFTYSRLKQIWYEYRPVKKKLHVLRHTAAVKYQRRTRDLQATKVFLGHVSINSTMVYTEHDETSELLQNTRV